MGLAKAWTAIDRLSIIWKSDLSDKTKHSFFQAVVVSILPYGCTTWTLTKRIEKKAWWELHQNFMSYMKQILEATSHKTASVRPPISHLKAIQIRRTRHAGHCWRSKDKLISDVHQWTLSHRRANVRRPARTYQQQLCIDTSSEAIDDRDEWRGGEERERDEWRERERGRERERRMEREGGKRERERRMERERGEERDEWREGGRERDEWRERGKRERDEWRERETNGERERERERERRMERERGEERETNGERERDEWKERGEERETNGERERGKERDEWREREGE